MSILNHQWDISPGADRVWAEVAGMRPALAGHRLMANLQAYIDESADEGGVFVMAGFISSAEQWARFSAEWEKLLQPFGTLKPGSRNYHFKYNEITARGTDRRERLPIFERVILDHVQFGISVRIHRGELFRAQSRLRVGGLEVQWERTKHRNMYYTAYRCLMDSFHQERAKMAAVFPPDAKVDFYFDEQVHEQKAEICPKVGDGVIRRQFEVV